MFYFFRAFTPFVMAGFLLTFASLALTFCEEPEAERSVLDHKETMIRAFELKQRGYLLEKYGDSTICAERLSWDSYSEVYCREKGVEIPLISNWPSDPREVHARMIQEVDSLIKL